MLRYVLYVESCYKTNSKSSIKLFDKRKLNTAAAKLLLRVKSLVLKIMVVSLGLSRILDKSVVRLALI